MAQPSPKVNSKKAAKWEHALSNVLLDGEVIWAFVSASRLKPLTMATAITNARIFGPVPGNGSTNSRLVVEVAANDIRGLDFAGKGTNMRVLTDAGETNFGRLDSKEVDFAGYFANYLWQNGINPDVANALRRRNDELAAADAATQWRLDQRGAVKVFGGVMKDKWWEDIDHHAHDHELPWFVINNGAAGRLVAFEDRLLISKTGGMTSMMAGSLGGGRETVFPYSEITNIEYNGGFANGVLEVLTPSYQGTGNHDYWRSSNKARNKAGDDPWTLSNCLPLPKAIYREVQPLLNELQRRIADAKQPKVIVQQAAQATVPAGAGLADELSKLADMHQRGLLDVEEFKAAKSAAIERLV